MINIIKLIIENTQQRSSWDDYDYWIKELVRPSSEQTHTEQDVLDRLKHGSSNHAVAELVSRSPKLTDHSVDNFIRRASENSHYHNDPAVVIAANRHLNERQIYAAIRGRSDALRASVAKNQNLTPDHVDSLLLHVDENYDKSPSYDFLSSLTDRQKYQKLKFNDEQLDKIVGTGHVPSIIDLFMTNQIKSRHLDHLIFHSNPQIRIHAVNSEQATPKHLEIAAADPEHVVRREVAYQDKTPDNVLQALSDDPEETVRSAAGMYIASRKHFGKKDSTTINESFSHDLPLEDQSALLRGPHTEQQAIEALESAYPAIADLAASSPALSDKYVSDSIDSYLNGSASWNMRNNIIHKLIRNRTLSAANLDKIIDAPMTGRSLRLKHGIATHHPLSRKLADRLLSNIDKDGHTPEGIYGGDSIFEQLIARHTAERPLLSDQHISQIVHTGLYSGNTRYLQHLWDHLKPEHLEQIAFHSVPSIRMMAARHPATPNHLLKALATDPNPHVRQTCIYHKNMDNDTLESLTHDPAPNVESHAIGELERRRAEG